MQRAFVLLSVSGLLGLLGLLSLLIAACASGDRLTLDEYARFCSDGVNSAVSAIEPEQLTWGELANVAQRSADALRSVSPPQDLSRFHRESLSTMEFVAEVSAEQPAAELASPLAFGLSGIRVATQLRRAIESLPTDVRRTLADAGCL